MAFLDETGLAYFWNQILARLNNFVPAETGKGLSSNDYTTDEKTKLSGIETGANKITVDSALSSTSTNPVQNKIVNTKFDSIQADIDNKADIAYGQYAITTAGDGAAYTATVPGITSLTVGASFMMIPNVASTSTTPTLNVNGLGAKTIKRRLSSVATSLQSGYTAGWLAEGVPFRMFYDGTYWVVEDNTKPASADLYGTLSVSRGGTGVTSLTELATALGASKIATGSYTGAGTYGSSNPNELTFDFVPKILIIVLNYNSTTNRNIVFAFNGLSAIGGIYIKGSDSGLCSDLVFNFGTTTSWYTTNTNSSGAPPYQMNSNGGTYCYYAIG